MYKTFLRIFLSTMLKNAPFPIILLAINYFDGGKDMLKLFILFLAWLIIFSAIATIIKISKQK